MNLKLYFLRHGETEYSRTGGFCGDIDPELTDAGKEMARQFAQAHSTTPWLAIYCSPMRRAVETAQPLCDAAKLQKQVEPGLKEISYGAWEGKTADWVKENYPDDYARWLLDPAWNAPTGGETAQQISDRAMPVIFDITRKYTSGNVLIVSHKATIRIMLCSLLGIELGRYRDRINALAASLSMVQFNEHGPLLEFLGDRSYMTKELLSRQGT